MQSQSEDITVEYDCHIQVSLKDCHLMTILAAFAVLLPPLFTKFLENILLDCAACNLRYLAGASPVVAISHSAT